ncbi:MAG: hypothetical protein HY984_01120 [Candidatus Magasanikbacteria bacterium]|nr:hypothetical protein [Candidatus Magasanikbacteria bacterium]
MTDLELANLYATYCEKYINTYVYSWLPNAIEGTFGQFTKELRAYLEPRGRVLGRDDELGEILSSLTTPLKLSYRQQEEEDFLRLLSRIEERDEYQMSPDLWQIFLRHTEQYAWIPFDYDGPAWTPVYFLDRARSFFAQDKSALPELAARQLARDALARRQTELDQALNLSSDPYGEYLFSLARELMYLKDYRKDVFFQTYYHLDQLIREIGRRLRLSPYQVKHILPSEMNAALVDRQYDERILNERIRHTVIVYRPEGMEVAVGEAAERLVRQLVEEVPTPTEVTELTGETAFPGRVTGPVVQVCRVADMKKMTKGAILVSPATNPNLIPAMRLAGAIVTDKGGITSHAAIIARELRIPCVTGTRLATKSLKDGDLVEVDAGRGVVKKIC